MKNFLTSSFLLLLPLFAASQSKWEGGLYLGFTNYGGDLVEPKITLKESNVAFGVLARRQITPLFNARFNFLYGKISGSDKNYDNLIQRDIKFKSPVYEFTLTCEHEILGKKHFVNDTLHRMFSPYVFAGVGMTIISPDTDYNIKEGDGVSNELKDKDAHFNYSNTQFSLPIGLGVKYDLTNNLNIGFEYGIRLVWTDYLDGVSQAGNPNKNDVYFSGGIVLAYRFNKKEHI